MFFDIVVFTPSVSVNAWHINEDILHLVVPNFHLLWIDWSAGIINGFLVWSFRSFEQRIIFIVYSFAQIVWWGWNLYLLRGFISIVLEEKKEVFVSFYIFYTIIFALFMLARDTMWLHKRCHWWQQSLFYTSAVHNMPIPEVRVKIVLVRWTRTKYATWSDNQVWISQMV